MSNLVASIVQVGASPAAAAGTNAAPVMTKVPAPLLTMLFTPVTRTPRLAVPLPVTGRPNRPAWVVESAASGVRARVVTAGEP